MSVSGHSLTVKSLVRKLPILVKARVKELQWKRNVADWRGKVEFAAIRKEEDLPYVVMRHKSLLRRTLAGTDPKLQENKIVNLGLSVKTIDGVVIRPGETFSLWKLVGDPTAKKGYIEGLTISHGKVKVGVGGGLCQLANLIFWLGLHTPLEVAERHHHAYDLFPDHHRMLPFGSGTTIFYNYLDLRFYNPTTHTFQLRLWLTDQFLEGAIHSNGPLPDYYRIEERNHRFEQEGDKWYRKNEIWRLRLNPENGTREEETLLIRNCSEVRYHVDSSCL